MTGSIFYDRLLFRFFLVVFLTQEANIYFENRLITGMIDVFIKCQEWEMSKYINSSCKTQFVKEICI